MNHRIPAPQSVASSGSQGAPADETARLLLQIAEAEAEIESHRRQIEIRDDVIRNLRLEAARRDRIVDALTEQNEFYRREGGERHAQIETLRSEVRRLLDEGQQRHAQIEGLQDEVRRLLAEAEQRDGSIARFQTEIQHRLQEGQERHIQIETLQSEVRRLLEGERERDEVIRTLRAEVHQVSALQEQITAAHDADRRVFDDATAKLERELADSGAQLADALERNGTLEDRLAADLRVLHDALARSDAYGRSVTSSLSWRVTAPLRAIARMIRRR